MLAVKRAKRAAYMRAYRKRKREEIADITLSKQTKTAAERKYSSREHIKQQFGDVRRSNAEYMRAYRKRKAEQRNAEYSSILPLLIQGSILEPVVEMEIKEEPFFLEQGSNERKFVPKEYTPCVQNKTKEEDDECGSRVSSPDALALEVTPEIEEEKIYKSDGRMKTEAIRELESIRSGYRKNKREMDKESEVRKHEKHF